MGDATISLHCLHVGRGQRLHQRCGHSVPDFKSRLGQTKAGHAIDYNYQFRADVLLEPYAGIQAIWIFSYDGTADGFSQPVKGESAVPAGGRGRTEIEVRGTALIGVGLEL